MARSVDNLESIPTSSLRSSQRNARTHSPAQIAAIARSIERFGFLNPILADASGRVIAGHGRLEAAKSLGLQSVPVVRIEHLSEAEKRAYVIADNRLAELAGWDRDLLRLELGELSIEAPDLDLTLTGYETGEIDLIVAGPPEEIAADSKADAVPVVDRGAVVSRPGDVWILGEHRLGCGDARNTADLDRLMAGERARMVLTDPPYNVPIAGHVRGKGSRGFEEFAFASGEMSVAEFRRFLGEAFGQMVRMSVDGAVHMVFMDWRHLGDALAAGEGLWSDLLNICVWSKTNAGMGSLYRSQHEMVLVAKVGKAPHVNNVGLGRFGRWRSNVWRYAGANAFGGERDDLLRLHPTVKPVAMLADAILDVTARGDLVLDPFAGSGSTIVAAEKTGRRARALEIDPAYVDVAIRRFESFTGIPARHAETGLAFADVAKSRNTPSTAALPTDRPSSPPLSDTDKPRIRCKAGWRSLED